MVLGFKSLRSMAIALWTQSLIVEASKKSFFDANRFTKNGSFVGYFSSVLVQSLDSSNSTWSKEEVYAGGVLCNISTGLLAVLHPGAFDAVYRSAKEHNWSLEKAFHERYDHELGELGPIAARSLGLPDIFTAVVAHIDYPQGAMDYFHPLAILNFAKAQADANGFGLQRWDIEFAVSGAVAELVDLPEERIKEIVSDARKHTLIHCPANAA